MNAPTERDVKKLYALSLNRCAFPDCASPIFGPAEEMIGEICHIKGRSPGGPRYDPGQTDTERHGFGNLILLCRNHHRVVDDDTDRYTPEWLAQIKREREAAGVAELNQGDLKRVRDLLGSLAMEGSRASLPRITNQSASGKNITQVAGDYHHYENPPKQKVFVTPPAGAVSSAELVQVGEWISDLVAHTTGMSQKSAFGMWNNRLKHRAKVRRMEQVLSAQMPNVEQWYRQQLAILKRGLKHTAPDLWRQERYTAIHAGMASLGVEKEAYYEQAAVRLKMKKTFSSCKQLTKTDLERLYRLVLADQKNLEC